MRYVLLVVASLVITQLACFTVDIPRQDCEMVGFDIRGVVVNAKNEPIANAEVVIDGEVIGGTALDMTVATDAEGRFQTEEILRFRCEPFSVSISAAGYVSYEETFYPRANSVEELFKEIDEALTVVLEQ